MITVMKIETEVPLPTNTRALFAVVVFLLASTVVLAGVPGAREATRPPKVTELTECNSSSCHKAALRVKAWIDGSEKPCNNFFQFACGSWINNSVIPDKQSGVHSLMKLYKKLLTRVKTILESNMMTEDEKTNKMITKMRKYYKNCLDRDNFGPTSKLLEQLFANIPLPYVNQTGWLNQGKAEFERFLADLALNDVNVLLTSNVTVDVRNNSKHIFCVDQPPMKLGSRRYYIEDGPTSVSVRNAYKMLMERVLDKVYKDLNITNATVDADAMIALQIKIVNATTPEKLRRELNKTDNRWKVQRLVNSTNTFNWQKYLDQRMSILKSGQTLEDEDIIMMKAPEYFVQLEEILDDTVKDTIGQLATFLLVDRFQEMLNKEYRSIFADFRKVLKGTRGDDTRWKQCAKYIKDTLFIDVLSRAYSQQYFDKTSKTEVLDVLSYVKEAFYKLLEVNTWMDNATRQVAVKKFKKMSAFIGYPDYIHNGTYLEEYYSEIPVNDGEFFMDQLKINRIFHERKLKALYEKVDKKRQITKSVVMDCYYKGIKNQMFLGMGILHAPIFDKNYPKYLNYGSIGNLMGHEITHGFDDTGKKRDENGNVRTWWPSSTVASFDKAVQCMVAQYSRYKAPIKIRNITLNGLKTLGENIADNGGIKVSFKAYKEWVRKHGKSELKLPGLLYTPDQLFFISFAQTMCYKTTEKGWLQYISKATYSPPMYRVIGTLSNLPDFHKAFECQTGDQMNPSHKCSVW